MRNPIYILNKFYNRIFNMVLLIVLFVLFSILGLMMIENFDFLESFWTVTNIITTVGSSIRSYQELSEEGRIFIVFIMWVGIGIFLTGITILASDLLQGKYQKAFKQYNMEKKLSNLENHVIICGFGRNGRQAARKIMQSQMKFVVIDKHEYDYQAGGEFDQALIYKGDATKDSTLKTCGIERAKAMITALPSDADNLFAVISGRQLNPKIKLISRASDSDSIEKLKLAGADNVIMPDKIGGEHMASLVVTPDLVEFIDQINFEGNNQRNLIEVPTDQISPEFLDEPLSHYLDKIKTDCKVIGYKHADLSYVMNPDLDMKVRPDEYIIFFGRNDQINGLRDQLNLK